MPGEGAYRVEETRGDRALVGGASWGFSETSSAASSAARWGDGRAGSTSAIASSRRSDRPVKESFASASAGLASRTVKKRSRAASIPARQIVVFPMPASPAISRPAGP